MRKLRLVLTAVLAAVPFLPPSLHAAVLPTFTAGNEVVSSGSSVSVPITVSDFSGVRGAQFTMSWSAGVLNYVGTGNYNSQLAAVGLGGGNFGTSSSGTLTFAWSDSSALGQTLDNGTTMFAVQFTAIGAVGTFSPVSFGGNPTPMYVTLSDLTEGTPFTVNGGVSVVPEPVNMALGIFGGVLLVVTLARSRRVRNRVHGWCVGVNQWLDAV